MIIRSVHVQSHQQVTRPVFEQKQATEWASQAALEVKNLPTKAGDLRDVGLIPGVGRSPEGGNSSPCQYSCPENPMGRGPWTATVHGVAESNTMEMT